jgi:hypothetical protein
VLVDLLQFLPLHHSGQQHRVVLLHFLEVLVGDVAEKGKGTNELVEPELKVVVQSQ